MMSVKKVTTTKIIRKLRKIDDSKLKSWIRYTLLRKEDLTGVLRKT